VNEETKSFIYVCLCEYKCTLTSLNTENCTFQKKNKVKENDRKDKSCEAGMDYGRLIHGRDCSTFINQKFIIYTHVLTASLQICQNQIHEHIHCHANSITIPIFQKVVMIEF